MEEAVMHYQLKGCPYPRFKRLIRTILLIQTKTRWMKVVLATGVLELMKETDFYRRYPVAIDREAGFFCGYSPPCRICRLSAIKIF